MRRLGAGPACLLLVLAACDDRRAPPPPAPRVSKSDTPKPSALIATAREAVAAKQWNRAHNALMMLEVVDPEGPFTEERLLLQVRTLMAVSPNEAAEEKADELHRAFPSSRLGPQVEDALLPLYRLEPNRQRAREAHVRALRQRSQR